MQRNIKSIKRENLKRARAFREYSLPPKATGSPYFCPAAVDQAFWKGKLPVKSSSESRVLKAIRRQTKRNERRAAKLAANKVAQQVRLNFSQQFDDDTIYDSDIFATRTDLSYYL